jgi:hypothetical protein
MLSGCPGGSTGARAVGQFPAARIGPIAVISICALCACATAGVQTAFMALDTQGDRQRTEFYTDTQAIFCDVQYSSGRTDLTIDTTIRSTQLWSNTLQALVPLSSVQAVGETAGQQGVGSIASFQWQLSPPSDDAGIDEDAEGAGGVGGGVTQQPPYPVGDFVCDIMLDGQLAASVPFTIRFPTCPVAPAVGGVTCAGWVQEGSHCPDSVGTTCTCTSGSWQC